MDLADDVIDIIFYYVEDKYVFIHINSQIYQRYKNKIKYGIFNSITNDYKTFRRCLNMFNYNYDEIIHMGVIGLSNIKLIYELDIRVYYDLRFLFELMLLGLDLNHPLITRLLKMNIEIMLKKIKRSISFSRHETILNINSEVSLRSLHYMFQPIYNNKLTLEYDGKIYNVDKSQWIYI